MSDKVLKDTNNETIIKRTTLNGAKWQIIPSFFGGYALYLENYKKDGYHFSGYTFKTLEDAMAHLDKVDERVKNPMQFPPCEIPADYYGVAGRYYGD